MPFLKNIAGVRAAGVKVNSDLSFDYLAPAFLQVEQNIIKPLITPQLYTALDDKYNSTAPNYTAGEETLIQYIQYLVAPLGLLVKARQLGIKVDDSGTYKNKGQDKWILSDTEQANWLQALSEEASGAREMLIQYLEETASATVFQPYYTSIASAGFKELRLKNAEEFSRYYDIYPAWATFRTLRPFMKMVQYDRIKPLLNGYYTTFLTINPGTDQLKDLVYLAERAIVYLSTARAMMQRKVSLTTAGITVVDEKERYGTQVTVSAAELMSTYNSLVQDGESSLQALDSLIQEIAPEGYTAPEAIENINDITNGIYLA